MIKNVAESIRVAKEIKAKATLCWRNSVDVIYKLPDYSNASYVEGIIVRSKGETKLEPHGWIERDAEIIDPTLPDMELEYFPALKWLGSLEVTIMEGRCMELPFHNTPLCKVDASSPQMEAARRAAQEWLDGLLAGDARLR